MDARKAMLMIMTALAASASVIYLQRKFDMADEKNGVEIAKSYRAPSGRTLVEVIELRHPGSVVSWSSSEQSSCFQHVRVDAHVTPVQGGAPIEYWFDIDLNGPSIHPANPHGVEAIAALDTSATSTPVVPPVLPQAGVAPVTPPQAGVPPISPSQAAVPPISPPQAGVPPASANLPSR